MPQPILIVGSLNIDLVAYVDQLPMPGETRTASDFQTLAGGKGANQACAVGWLGGLGRMVGVVGSDPFGEELIASLQVAGVDRTYVQRLDGIATGVAMIHVSSSGENHIVISPGANAHLTPDLLPPAFAEVDSGYLLLQLETPLPTVIEGARLAKSRGMTVILDPAPVQALPSELLSYVDLITPNQTEAMALVGRKGPLESLDEVEQVAQEIRDLGVPQVIVKLGSLGSWVQDPSGGRHHAAPKVNPLDTTAAGDTFNGALGVGLAEGKSFDEAVAWANRAAALSVTRRGAQSSIPTRKEVDQFVET